jgi:hypothetical protein
MVEEQAGVHCALVRDIVEQAWTLKTGLHTRQR